MIIKLTRRLKRCVPNAPRRAANVHLVRTSRPETFEVTMLLHRCLQCGCVIRFFGRRCDHGYTQTFGRGDHSKSLRDVFSHVNTPTRCKWFRSVDAECADLSMSSSKCASCPEPIHYHHNRRPHENDVHKQPARQPGISRQPISSPSSLPGCPSTQPRPTGGATRRRLGADRHPHRQDSRAGWKGC